MNPRMSKINEDRMIKIKALLKKSEEPLSAYDIVNRLNETEDYRQKLTIYRAVIRIMKKMLIEGSIESMEDPNSNTAIRRIVYIWLR